eukprot:COSAG01_NODE_5798_length_4029_cov_6.905344_2_plen_43_part_00
MVRHHSRRYYFCGLLLGALMPATLKLLSIGCSEIQRPNYTIK